MRQKGLLLTVVFLGLFFLMASCLPVNVYGLTPSEISLEELLALAPLKGVHYESHTVGGEVVVTEAPVSIDKQGRLSLVKKGQHCTGEVTAAPLNRLAFVIHEGGCKGYSIAVSDQGDYYGFSGISPIDGEIHYNGKLVSLKPKRRGRSIPY